MARTNTKTKALADVLIDEKWHDTTELVERVGHRFGAGIHLLRTGSHDGMCWDIQGERTEQPGIWRYRCAGFKETYETHGPVCPKCGTRMLVHDVRSAA